MLAASHKLGLSYISLCDHETQTKLTLNVFLNFQVRFIVSASQANYYLNHEQFKFPSPWQNSKKKKKNELNSIGYELNIFFSALVF
jgi:hypothetical protein